MTLELRDQIEEARFALAHTSSFWAMFVWVTEPVQPTATWALGPYPTKEAALTVVIYYRANPHQIGFRLIAEAWIVGGGASIKV